MVGLLQAILQAFLQAAACRARAAAAAGTCAAAAGAKAHGPALWLRLNSSSSRMSVCCVLWRAATASRRTSGGSMLRLSSSWRCWRLAAAGLHCSRPAGRARPRMDILIRVTVTEVSVLISSSSSVWRQIVGRSAVRGMLRSACLSRLCWWLRQPVPAMLWAFVIWVLLVWRYSPIQFWLCEQQRELCRWL